MDNRIMTSFTGINWITYRGKLSRKGEVLKEYIFYVRKRVARRKYFSKNGLLAANGPRGD
jgi:hypothetical protein